MLTRARRLYQDEGGVALVRRSFRFGYDELVRPFLPRREVSYNGVRVHASRLGDSIIPWQNTDIETYEDALIRGIRNHAQEDDSVVIVGGGWGVSTVVAAIKVGSGGKVITYEGAKEAVDDIRDTVLLNDVQGRVSLEHAVVAEEISLRGDSNGSEPVPPSELPECDVLVLDCEGAEVEILEKMNIRPRVMIVETHGMYGAPEPEVRNQLTELGYQVSDPVVAEERLHEVCDKNGIFVLVASEE